MAHDEIKAEIVKPSALGKEERAQWHALLQNNLSLRRAFLAPEYGLACERANAGARVIVFRRQERPIAFFPFRFASSWHSAVRSGESLPMCDQSGLLAPAGFSMSPELLLASARLNALYMKCLPEEQTAFGLTAGEWEAGHLIELHEGPEAYLKALATNKLSFVRETERKLRRTQREFGDITYTFNAAPTLAAVNEILDEKRRQYERTDVPDIFRVPENGDIIAALLQEPTAYCRPVVSVLKAGNKVLAQHFGLLCGDVLSYWFPVYDTELKGISAGRLLLWHMITSAGRDGVSLIDLGEGDVRYKKEFSTAAVRYGTAHWHAKGLVSLPARAQRSLIWRYRRMTGRVARA